MGPADEQLLSRRETDGRFAITVATNLVDSIHSDECAPVDANESSATEFDLQSLQSLTVQMHTRSDMQRHVIVMRFVEQKSIREIATELDRSEGAVKQLQFRCRIRRPRCVCDLYPAMAGCRGVSTSARFATMLSMMPYSLASSADMKRSRSTSLSICSRGRLVWRPMSSFILERR